MCPDAFVFINDKFAGIGDTYADYLKPGTNTIKIRHPDYFEQTGIVELSPYEEKKFDITLEKIELGFVSLSSLPPNAWVYKNSIYSGITPLNIEKSSHLKRIVIKKEEFDDFIFHIGHTSNDTIVAELQQSLVDPEKKQKDERDDFYSAFGLLLVSIPVPVFLNGFSKDFKDIANNDDFDGAVRNQYKLMSNIFEIAYWVTLGVTGGLLVNMGFNLADYIKAADRPIG